MSRVILCRKQCRFGTKSGGRSQWLLLSSVIHGETCKDKKTIIDYCHLFPEVVFEAATNGNLVRYDEEIYEDLSPAMNGSVAGNHIENVRLLLNEGVPRSADAICHVETVEMLNFLLDNGFSRDYMLQVAANRGKLNLVIRLLELELPTFLESDVLRAACRSGNLTLVQHLIIVRKIPCQQSTVEVAISNGNLEMIQWLVTRSDVVFDNSWFESAARSGNFELFEWLLASHPITINLAMCHNAAISESSSICKIRCP